MVKKLTTEEFIQKAKAIHGDKYDYSAVVYINNYTKIKVFCKRCEKYFETTPANCLRGKGCPHCKGIRAHERFKMSNEYFIEKAKKIHGNKYDYSAVNYVNAHTKVKIFCKTCQKYFECEPANHYHKKGCPICARKRAGQKLALTADEFLTKLKKISGKRYEILNNSYCNRHTKVKVLCNKCKKIFESLPGNLLSGHGCPYCKQSKGELSIQSYLNTKHITYIVQYRFKDCKDKRPLPFDFYLPERNLCIEFQGAQHYKTGKRFFTIREKGKEVAEEKFKLQKKHDRIKKKYCKNNNINFLEIKYDENIEKKLQECFDKLDSN